MVFVSIQGLVLSITFYGGYMRNVNVLQVGYHHTGSFVVSDEMISRFCVGSGDFNPIHTDDKVAQQEGYERRIAHGMLTSTLVNSLIVVEFPGIIEIERKSTNMRPVYVDDRLEIEAVITDTKLTYRLRSHALWVMFSITHKARGKICKNEEIKAFLKLTETEAELWEKVKREKELLPL